MPLITVDAQALAAARAADRSESVAALRLAGMTTGGFALKRAGIPDAKISKAFAAARAFFALPESVKLRYASSRERIRGYHPFPKKAGDIREKFLVTRALSSRDPAAPSPMPGENLWPKEVPHFEEAISEILVAMEHLGRRVMRGISESLGLPPKVFGEAFDPPGGALAWLLHYPAVPLDSSGRRGQGTSAHTDLHPVALILQDGVSGLEIHGPDGWEEASGRIVCQMGGLTARWSNDAYKSCVHRVRNDPAHSRFSLCVFMSPAFDHVVVPLASCVGPVRPGRYPPATFAKCYLDWLSGLESGGAGYIPGI